MTRDEILSRLCVYDSRNPVSADLQDPDEPCQPRVDCACDNCFYGRDRLAVALLDERAKVEELAEAARDWRDCASPAAWKMLDTDRRVELRQRYNHHDIMTRPAHAAEARLIAAINNNQD